MMLDEYSIEQRATQIFDARTKEYFSEVVSCYAAGNYRSSVVMLWSVAVCDLLFKLQHLVDLYGDDKAKGILAEIGKLQQDNERSPIWEVKLVESVAEQTQLLDISERENLLYLQRQRHLAAHPVVNANFQLHRPNHETARALIRNTLDGVLIKAPILSKQIVSELVNDLEQAAGILIDEKRLKAYLESKYFSRFNPEVERTVFKALWKLVFRLLDEKCEENRRINYSALRLLYARNHAQFLLAIEDDRSYFSAIANGGTPIGFLINFLSANAQIYGLLEEHAKMAIRHFAENDNTARCQAWFVCVTLNEHAEALTKWVETMKLGRIEAAAWADLLLISDSVEWSKKVRTLANRYYCASVTYDTADERFGDAIRPLLPLFDLEDCVDLIEKIERNSETWERRRAKNDHGAVRTHALQVGPELDISMYPNFNKYLV